MTADKRNFTLLELIIVMAILSIIFTGAITFMDSADSNIQLEEQIINENMVISRLLQSMTTELRQAQIARFADSTVTDLDDEGEEVWFLVPVDYDGDGDVMDGDLEVEWGASRPDVELGITPEPYAFPNGDYAGTDNAATFYRIYRFEPEMVVSTDVDGTVKTYADGSSMMEPDVLFNESEKGVDFNKDGDTKDILYRGKILVVDTAGTYTDEDGNVYSVPENTNYISNTTIVAYMHEGGDGLSPTVLDTDGKYIANRAYFSYPGKIDTDEEEDPIFRKESTTLWITLFVLPTDGGVSSPDDLDVHASAVELRNVTD